METTPASPLALVANVLHVCLWNIYYQKLVNRLNQLFFQDVLSVSLTSAEMFWEQCVYWEAREINSGSVHC